MNDEAVYAFLVQHGIAAALEQYSEEVVRSAAHANKLWLPAYALVSPPDAKTQRREARRAAKQVYYNRYIDARRKRKAQAAARAQTQAVRAAASAAERNADQQEKCAKRQTEEDAYVGSRRRYWQRRDSMQREAAAFQYDGAWQVAVDVHSATLLELIDDFARSLGEDAMDNVDALRLKRYPAESEYGWRDRLLIDA